MRERDGNDAEVRERAAEWLEHFREEANPQTAEERWAYLDEAATLIEELVYVLAEVWASIGCEVIE